MMQSCFSREIQNMSIRAWDSKCFCRPPSINKGSVFYIGMSYKKSSIFRSNYYTQLPLLLSTLYIVIQTGISLEAQQSRAILKLVSFCECVLAVCIRWLMDVITFYPSTFWQLTKVHPISFDTFLYTSLASKASTRYTLCAQVHSRVLQHTFTQTRSCT